MGWSVRVQFLAGARDFSSPKMCRLDMGPTQTPIQLVQVFFSLGVSGLGVKQTVVYHLVLRLRMSGAKPPLPQQAFKVCIETSLLSLHFNIIISFMPTSQTNLFISNFLISHPTHASLPVHFNLVNFFKLNLNLL
jgi:hypothetical protein